MRKAMLPRNVKANIRKVGPAKIEISNAMKYSKIHDEGKGRIPQREFMWLSDKAQGLMAKAIVFKMRQHGGI